MLWPSITPFPYSNQKQLETANLHQGSQSHKNLTTGPIPQWYKFQLKFLDTVCDLDQHQNQMMCWQSDISPIKKNSHNNLSSTSWVVIKIHHISLSRNGKDSFKEFLYPYCDHITTKIKSAITHSKKFNQISSTTLLIILRASQAAVHIHSKVMLLSHMVLK